MTAMHAAVQREGHAAVGSESPPTRPSAAGCLHATWRAAVVGCVPAVVVGVRAQAVALLLSAGTPVDALTQKGYSALMYAAAGGPARHGPYRRQSTGNGS